jgi:hypothetical protein
MVGMKSFGGELESGTKAFIMENLLKSWTV